MKQPPTSPGDRAFMAALGGVCALFVGVVVALLVADAAYASPGRVLAVLVRPEVRASALRTVLTCTLSTALAMALATPLAYAVSRRAFRGRAWVDTLIDAPTFMPPLALGVSLLILLEGWPLKPLAPWVVYQPAAIVVAQTLVATSLAARVLRGAFAVADPRAEDVALTLGCSRLQAFWRVALPEARPALLAAATLAWARCLGEFGPVLVFAGAIRGKTEVLSTTIYLELTTGDLRSAVAVTLLLSAVAIAALVLARRLVAGEPPT